MGRKTNIGWCDATANVVVGCTKISPGCANCFAAELAATRLSTSPRYEGLARVIDNRGTSLAVLDDEGKPRPDFDAPGSSNWTGVVRVVSEAIDAVMRWTPSPDGRPLRVFLTAMGDPHHESLTTSEVIQFYALIAASPWNTYQVLTKRAHNMAAFFRRVDAGHVADAAVDLFDRTRGRTLGRSLAGRTEAAKWRYRIANARTWPLRNAELGVTVERQDEAMRLYDLAQLPAAVRWVSFEPLLASVRPGTIIEEHRRLSFQWSTRFDALRGTYDIAEGTGDTRGSWSPHRPLEILHALDWGVVGGESGRRFRELNIEHMTSLVDDLVEAGTRVFVKQDSGRYGGAQGRIPDSYWQRKELPR